MSVDFILSLATNGLLIFLVWQLHIRVKVLEDILRQYIDKKET